MIRSDMDALPIAEETGLPFASTHSGCMHACGHDSHMAMALGAAAVLNRLRDRIRGNVKFVFQPAEEGPGGAQPMIAAGVLENPKVDYAIGCHLWSERPEGYLGVRPDHSTHLTQWVLSATCMSWSYAGDIFRHLSSTK
jgi:amidohydrolase